MTATSIPDRVGRYRVIRLLGTGATSSVFLGHDEALDSPVAIKVLAENLAARPAIAERFLSEARLLRSIADPHIVAVRDVGTLDSGPPYMVMDYLTATLADELRSAPVDAAGTRALVDRLHAMLAAIHAKGIVHGDVKPENVFVRDDRLVAGDFGVAADTGEAAGGATAAYAPPEQLAGATIDQTADLYAATAIVMQAAGKERARLRDWESIARAERPEARYRDAAAWRAGYVGAVERRARPRRGVLIAAALLFVAGVVGLVLSITGGGSPVRLDNPVAVAANGSHVVAVEGAGPANFGTVVVLDEAGEPTSALDALSNGAIAVSDDGTVFTAVGPKIFRNGTEIDELNDDVIALGASRTVAALTSAEEAFVVATPSTRLASLSKIADPVAITVDRSGTAYVLDGAHTLSELGPTTTRVVVNNSQEPGNVIGASALESQLQSPTAIAAAPNGDVYIADAGNQRVVALRGDQLEPVASDLPKLTSIAVTDDRVYVVTDGELRALPLP